MTCPNCQTSIKNTARFCTSCGISITGSQRPTVQDSQAFRTNYDPAADETVVRADKFIGRVLGEKYQLLARLGEGGMGTVYRARRIHIGDEVAVKILHGKYVAEEDGIERFRREARAAAMLHHPNVVTIHDYGESTGDASPAFIVMELISGASLRELLRREGRLSIEMAVALMSHICAGVAAAHRQNIIHRDLKPDNVLVLPPEDEDNFGTAKVVDFGIAKLRDLAATHMLTLTHDIIGTPYYMSPEQCRGESLDARSDVYSLGAMMYEMLAGVRPFTSHTPTAVISKQLTEPPPPFAHQLGIPSTLEAVILRALAKDANDRQADAAGFGRELRVALSRAASSIVEGVAAEHQQAPVERFHVPVFDAPVNTPVNANLHTQQRQPVSQPVDFSNPQNEPPRIAAPVAPPMNAAHHSFYPAANGSQHSDDMVGRLALALIVLCLLGVGCFALLKWGGNQPAQQNTAISALNPNTLAPATTTNTQPHDTAAPVIIPPANVNESTAMNLPVKETPANKNESKEQDKNRAQATDERIQREEATRTNSAETAAVNVTGDWQCYFGVVRLTQSGSAITGTIRYADGSGMGRIRGTMRDRKLSFQWNDDTSSYNGAGTVTLSANGRSLKGSIRLDGTTQPLELVR